jgi:prepilin-type N-terminal cleavage/methylation domain-containing protein
MTFRKAKGFTLVEMLVVIAIIAILAAALFPQIQNAIDQARATAMKNKGRGIWIGLVSANNERTVLSKDSAWPTELNKTTGTAYFQAMFADNDGAFSTEPDGQLVSDVKTDMLSARGFPPAAKGTSPAKENIAWRVFGTSDDSGGGDAFMASKDLGDGTAVTIVSNTTSVALSSKGPFGGRRVTYVTVGGGCLDARKIYLKNLDLLMGGTTNTIYLLAD